MADLALETAADAPPLALLAVPSAAPTADLPGLPEKVPLELVFRAGGAAWGAGGAAGGAALVVLAPAPAPALAPAPDPSARERDLNGRPLCAPPWPFNFPLTGFSLHFSLKCTEKRHCSIENLRKKRERQGGSCVGASHGPIFPSLFLGFSIEKCLFPCILIRNEGKNQQSVEVAARQTVRF